jgi:hypothetical protein
MSHPIYDLLQAETDPVLRRRIKAQALAAMTDLIGESVDRGAFRITLTDIDYYPAHDALRFRLRINRISNGNNVTPADLNPIIVVNPPILVDDAAGDIVLSGTDPVTGLPWERRLREDLREVIRDVVRGIAAQRLG